MTFDTELTQIVNEDPVSVHPEKEFVSCNEANIEDVSLDSTVLEDRVKQEVINEANIDVNWSITSNLFFLSGGILYVITAIWDSKGEPEDSYENYYYVYMFLNLLAALVYLANGLIDVTWSLKARKRDQNQTEEVERSGETSDLNETPSSIEEECVPRRCFGTTFRTGPKGFFLQRLFRDEGHRRNMNASVFFAVAAFFGVLAMVAGYQGAESTSVELDEISIFVYLLSAFFALYGRDDSDKNRLSWMHAWWDSDRLEDLGDILFGVGSMLDTILMFTNYAESVLWWQVLAAILWLVDALLYLRADYVVYAAIQDEMSPELDAKKVEQLSEETEAVLSSEHVIS